MKRRVANAGVLPARRWKREIANAGVLPARRWKRGSSVVAAIVAVVVSAGCAGCGGKANSRARAPSVEVTPMDAIREAAAALPARLVPARSHVVGTISRRAIGPFTARGANGGLVAWIVASDHGATQDLVAVPTGIDGAPLAEERVVASVPQEASALVIRPSGGARGGWIVAWSALLDRGEGVSVIGLAPDGIARWKPVDIQRTSDHVKWLDVVAGAHGGSCVWAEETPSGAANILAAPLDTDGRPQAMPVRVVRGVRGWTAAPDADGMVMALVTPPAEDRAGAGMLSWASLDTEGRVRSPTVPIGTRPTVSSDVEVVSTPSGWLLGWTDRTGEDPQVMLAMVDASGKVRGPHRAMDAVGGTALVGLASGPAGVALAWKEPHGRARATRPLHLALVSLEGELSALPGTAMEVASDGKPELTGTEHGFALLASAPGCADRARGMPCDGTIVPTFLRVDARLEPTQVEPLLVGEGHALATLGWGLQCAGDRCVALAATGATPTPVFDVDLGPRTSPFEAPISIPPPRDAPRVTGVVTVAAGQPFTDLATTRIEDVTLVATSTTGVDPGRGHDVKRGQGAAVAVRALNERGELLGTPTVITTRALPVGGIAIAAGGKPADGALVAWVTRDEGDPQVHLTHVDRRGARTHEVQLTTSKGDASDVALAWAGDGWLVAWVDGRDGNGEVYASKVDRDLNRVAREERITKAAGDASDVSLVAHGDTAWVAWSDPRESPGEGVGDIYVATLRTRDARRAGDEVRVLATAAHSRSPELGRLGDNAIVAWIEDAPTGLEGPGTAMVARLDPSGHVLGRPAPLPAATRGRPTRISVGPTADGLRVVLTRNDQEDVTLDAATIGADGVPGKTWPLLDLDAPPSFDVALAVEGDTVFFGDVGASAGDHRVRRAAISWSR